MQFCWHCQIRKKQSSAQMWKPSPSKSLKNAAGHWNQSPSVFAIGCMKYNENFQNPQLYRGYKAFYWKVTLWTIKLNALNKLNLHSIFFSYMKIKQVIFWIHFTQDKWPFKIGYPVYWGKPCRHCLKETQLDLIIHSLKWTEDKC